MLLLPDPIQSEFTSRPRRLLRATPRPSKRRRAAWSRPLSIKLLQGDNVLAVHVRQGQVAYFDAGIIDTGERVLIPTAKMQPTRWSYSTDTPLAGWESPAFKAANWKSGQAGFGAQSAVVGSEWKTADIWLRRDFHLAAARAEHLVLRVQHDDEAQIYLNGVLAADLKGFTANYVDVEVTPAALATLKPGRNTIAIHCRQFTGGQAIDAGLIDVAR